ncbi:MAG: methyltransferase [bacterium]|nr:methyltransferase [bacterium]
MQVYKPREDSYLLLDAVRKYSKGKVLEIGTGTGILAIEAAKKNAVVAVDINKNALRVAKKNAKKAKIKFIYSDLFSNVKGKFDTIIFNPPYLPEDKYTDAALSGGKKGYELTERFLEEARMHLSANGIILIVFSSLTKRMKVDQAIEKNGFEKELLDEKKIFFETLYVYKIKKTKVVKELEKKGVKDLKLFAKGHRGIIYTGVFKGKNIAVKTERKDSEAKDRVLNETKWIKILNKKGIGPKLLFHTKKYFAYEFVEGELVVEFLEKASKKRIKEVVKELFKQCFVMDKLGMTKEEMHRPVKHVLIGKKVVLIDFERAKKTKKPKNVTQLCQFMISENIRHILKGKLKIDKKKIIKLSKEYRKKMDYKKVLDEIIQ